jgi:hypothetical protein
MTSLTYYIASNYGIILSDESERMWKKVPYKFDIWINGQREIMEDQDVWSLSQGISEF